MAEERNETFIVLKIYGEDKKWITENKELEKYLSFKHRELVKRQEDLVHLIVLELQEIMASQEEVVKLKKGR